MAEQNKSKIEREYTIPLRKVWIKTPYYKRSRKAVMAIKTFIARHMKVPDRDTKKVKLDVYFNNDIWFRGSRKPPAKVKVKAIKEGDIVRVDFVEIPQYVSYLKNKHSKLHKKVETKKEQTQEVSPEVQEKAEESRDKEEVKKPTKEEKEKEQAVAEVRQKEAKQDLKAQKHTKEQKKDIPQKERRTLDRH